MPSPRLPGGTGSPAASPKARTLLAKFGLGADHVARPAASLSPGERTRATLALLQARGTNCLVLDEPTNHLDLPAIEQLEQAVEAFEGTVLLVTHDRQLLDAVTVTTHDAGRRRSRHRRSEACADRRVTAMSELRPYSVVAFNTATASANKIHDDAVAQRLGFRGGLVPGVDVYAYLTQPPVAAWGTDWLQRGTMRARFLQPVYDGDAVEVAIVGERTTSSCATARAQPCATATAAFPSPAVESPDLGDWPDRRAARPTRRRPRPRSSCRAPSSGWRPTRFRAENAGEYLGDDAGRPCRSTATRASPTRRGSSATPTTCCRPTSGSARGSTSSRPSSTSVSCATATVVSARGLVDRRVGAEGPPLRHPRRAAPRRRSPGRPHHPHRDLPATGHVSRT